MQVAKLSFESRSRAHGHGHEVVPAVPRPLALQPPAPKILRAPAPLGDAPGAPSSYLDPSAPHAPHLGGRRCRKAL